MKQNTTLFPALLAATLAALCAVALFGTGGAGAQTFVGPCGNPPSNTCGLLVASSTRALGIGTSTVFSTLGSMIFKTQGGASQHIVFQPNGNVGIATSTPLEKLSVQGNVQATSFIGSLAGGLAAANISSDVFGRLQGQGNFAFPASVGVSTSTQNGLPQPLSVYGNAFISGNLGVGTTTPGYALSVAGSMYSPMVMRGNSGASITIDWSQGNEQHVIVTSASVNITFTNGRSGARYTLVLRNGVGSALTPVWPGTIRWPGGVAPLLTSVSGKTDYLGFIYNGYDTAYDNIAANLNF